MAVELLSNKYDRHYEVRTLNHRVLKKFCKVFFDRHNNHLTTYLY